MAVYHNKCLYCELAKTDSCKIYLVYKYITGHDIEGNKITDKDTDAIHTLLLLKFNCNSYYNEELSYFHQNQMPFCSSNGFNCRRPNAYCSKCDTLRDVGLYCNNLVMIDNTSTTKNNYDTLESFPIDPCDICMGHKLSAMDCNECRYNIVLNDMKLLLKNFRPSGMIDAIYNELCRRYGITPDDSSK
jgi:hypothetical protein